MKNSVRIFLKFIMAFGFLIGLAVLFYPLFSNTWNKYNDKLKFQEYQQVANEKFVDEGLVSEWEKAHTYNDELQPIIIPDSFIKTAGMAEEDEEYMSCLNIREDGMMGSIYIPKIGERIPIYHTTSEEVLQKGAGHIQGSSLPVGGEGTHAAIAAHRGLPGASLFTDIDQLEEGDQFYLYILDDVLAYEIDQILTVEPSDTEPLGVEPGEDYVTLVTCTPYGVNTQRLLVRGHRIPYEEEQVAVQETKIVSSVHTNYTMWILLGLGVTAVCILLALVLLKCFRRLGKKREIANVLFWFLLLAASFVLQKPMQVQAADVETTRDCSVQFTVPSAYRGDLQSQTISVRLYRVAQITEAGNYQDIPGYESLGLGMLSSQTTAEQMKNLAEQTADFLQVTQWEETPVTIPDYQFDIVNNTGIQTNISCGLYLVCIKTTQAGNATYHALPYMISLPMLIETTNAVGERDLIWVYDLTIDLKLGCERDTPPEGYEEEISKAPEEGRKNRTGDDWALPVACGGAIATGIILAVTVIFDRKQRKKMSFGISIVFVACLLAIAMLYTRYYKMRQHNQMLQEMVTAETVEEWEDFEVETTQEVLSYCEENQLPLVNFKALKEVNEDCVAWIYACGGKISYPVVLSEDEYYLTHAIDGTEAKSGTVYANCAYEEPFAEGRTVIYGHHMRDGSMFKPLMRYWQEKGYLEEEKNIYIITEAAVYVYEITSVYVKEYEEISFLQNGVPVEEGEFTLPVIDLITCQYSGFDTRLVVEAVRKEIYQ